MKDFGFIIVFFAILILLALMPKGNGGFFSSTATSTATSTRTSFVGDSLSYSAPDTTQNTGQDAPKENPRLSNAETERRIADLSRTLDTLKEDVREAKLREPISPYTDIVTLSSGNTYTTDPDQEYLQIRVRSDAQQPVDLSGWYLKSYVTDESSALPLGDRLLKKWRSPQTQPILLLPGENAYVITGDSPIDTSFHENICTGYLTEHETFNPYLNRQCPRPLDEMKRFSNIKLDNDSCYDFVERLNSCRTPSDEEIENADINNACQRFIDDTLDYGSCVTNHLNDPFFDDVGHWYIYLEENEELWRTKREIIRLFDSSDRVVDVLEY